MLAAFLTFAVVASVTPGPNNIMLLASGANFGFRRTLPHLLGVILGFGLMVLLPDAGVADHKMFRGLGPEPLDPAFDGPALAGRLKGRKTPIKAALLDQKTLVGVGNIYACEALFLAGLSPRRSAHTVQGDRADRLARAIRQVLERSIADGGSTLRDHVQPGGELGYFQTRFNVYDRAGTNCPTPGCGNTVRRLVQVGRSTFYCTRCQR